MASCKVEELHLQHPKISAEDWRSPLVLRLLGSNDYSDGQRTLTDSYRPDGTTDAEESTLELTWQGLGDDFAKRVNTYQAPVLTEFATLGLACILVPLRAGQEITEVTRRGEKADYWLGDRDSLLEASGQASGNLDLLRESKAGQLLGNPFGMGGFVCVANYEEALAYLWFFDGGAQ